MEELNLSAAKEEATRENWNSRLPQYILEAEDDLPVEDTETGLKESFNPATTKTLDAEWLFASRSREEKDLDPPGMEDSCYMESDDLDDEEYKESIEDDYITEGEAEVALQTGAIRSMALSALRPLGEPVKDIGDRKVQVDLNYLPTPKLRAKTLSVIEAIVKKFSVVPGKVAIKQSAQPGVYVVHVTNNYFSPSPHTSSTESPPFNRKEGKVVKSSKKAAPIPYSELVVGVQLIPKFAGLPKRTLKYDELGLSPERIRGLIESNPGKTRNEILILALKLAGSYRRIANLYSIP